MKGENSPELFNSGGARMDSGQFRLMQRLELMQCLKVDGGSGAVGLDHWEEEDEVWKGKSEGPLSLFIRRMDKVGKRENWGAWSGKMGQSCRLNLRKLINEGNLYNLFIHRWHHDDLLQFQKMMSWRFTKVYREKISWRFTRIIRRCSRNFSKYWRLAWTGSNQSGA